MLTVFLLLIGGTGVALHRADFLAERPNDPLVQSEVTTMVKRDLETSVLFLATDILSQIEEPNLAQANIRFKEALGEMFEYRYDPARLDDHRFTVTSSDMEIVVMPMSLTASTCTDDTTLTGTTGTFTAPAYYRVKGTISFQLESKGRATSVGTLEVDRLVPDLAPYISTRLDEFGANGLSEFTDIGRMVRYMLTTLVRYRTIYGYGSGPYDSMKNLLNEGDIEMAVNIAILLEEARLFGTYDADAVDAIDHFFYHGTDPQEHLDELWWEPFNPTGIRDWGSAETKNYARYQKERPDFETRTLSSLFDKYVHEGVLDPADLMALYLNLDLYESYYSVDPLDRVSMLHENFLFDGRYPDDRRDPGHLEYFVDVGPRELVLKDPTGTFSGSYGERLSVDHHPDHLTVGSEIKVGRSLITPYKWMSNVRLSEGSRTGGVPPPQPPPEHDWVMLWELEISGEFTLSVGRDRTAYRVGGASDGQILNRTIRLDIPMNIYTPLWQRPMNAAMVFTNLNTGSPVGATYNFTKESLAYEHFSNSTWSAVKDLVGAVLGDTIGLVKASTCPYRAVMASGTGLGTISAATTLKEVPYGVWAEIDDLIDVRIVTPGLSTQVIRPVLNFEYFMDLDHIASPGLTGVSYILKMTIRTKVGDVQMDLMMLDDPLQTIGKAGSSSSIEVKGLLDVEYGLEWDDGLQDLRPVGTGTIGGEWSVPIQRKGEMTLDFVELRIPRAGPGKDIHVRLLYMGSPVEVAASIYTRLMGPGTGSLSGYMGSLDGMTLPGLTVLFTQASGPGTWYGLTAHDDDVQMLLDLIEENDDIIIDQIGENRLDAASLAALALDRMAHRDRLEVEVHSKDTISTTPLMYHSDALQLFQEDRVYGPLTLRTLGDMTVDEPSNEYVSTGTMTFDQCSETFLKGPEGSHD